MKAFFRAALAFSLIFAGLAISFRPGQADAQASAMNWSDLQIIQQINPVAWLSTPGPHFGFQGVTVGGDLMVVYDHSRANGAIYAGAAFLFVRENNHWVQKAALEPVSSVDYTGDFGTAVAISGNRIAISEPDHLDDQGLRTPQVYVYTWDGAQLTLEDTLAPSVPIQAPGSFGGALALKGNTLLVGAEGETVNSIQYAGAAYVYTRDDDGHWTQKAHLTASNPQPSFYFGFEAALDEDGGTALIRAAGIPGGMSAIPAKVFIAKQAADGWHDQAISDELAVPDGSKDCYNMQLVINSGQLAVSCPMKTVGSNEAQGVVYMYDKPESGWSTTMTPSATLYAEDGRPDNYLGMLGLDLRGNTLVASGGNVIYAFVKGTNGWKEQHRLTPPNSTLMSFGISVLDSDGSILVSAGRDNAGSSESTVFVYGNSPGSVDPIRLSATEGDGPVSYTLALRRAPTAPVTVNVVSGPRLSADPAQVVFTPANWSNPKTITLSSVDDQIADLRQDIGVAHVLTSADPRFNGSHAPTVNVDLTDNDSPGVTLVSPASPVNITYGASVPVQLRLSSQPTSDVIVHLDKSYNPDYSMSPDPLTFTPSDWDQSQSVTFSVNDNPTGWTDLRYFPFTFESSDLVYSKITSASVPVLLLSHPDPILWMSAMQAAIPEGDGVDVQIHLQSNPGADVTVSTHHWLAIQTTPPSLTFTKDNWNISQSLHIHVLDNHIADSANMNEVFVNFSSDSTNLEFKQDQLTPFYIQIQEIDQVGVQVSNAHFTLAEGGPQVTYQVSLASQPSEGIVYYTVNGGGFPKISYLSFTPNSISFDNTNWNQPQTITVNAPDDNVDHGSGNLSIDQSISHSYEYNGLSLEPLTVAYSDNDTYRMAISPTVANLTESQSQDFQISLQNQPTCDVTVQFSYDQYGYKNYDPWAVQVSPLSLTFTPDNWQTPQSIQVTALHDGNEPIRTTTLKPDVSSCNGYQLGKVPVTITDPDAPGIIVVLPDGKPIQLNEGGPAASYQIRLHSQPLFPVSITIDPGDGLQVSPAILTFTDQNWDQPQPVSVRALQNGIYEGKHDLPIQHSVTSDDGNYDWAAVPDVIAAVFDQPRVYLPLVRR